MNRIHGCRIEERETDDKWFSKHLGNICSQLVKDLEIVKVNHSIFNRSQFDYEWFVFIETLRALLSSIVQNIRLLCGTSAFGHCWLSKKSNRHKSAEASGVLCTTLMAGHVQVRLSDGSSESWTRRGSAAWSTRRLLLQSSPGRSYWHHGQEARLLVPERPRQELQRVVGHSDTANDHRELLWEQLAQWYQHNVVSTSNWIII